VAPEEFVYNPEAQSVQLELALRLLKDPGEHSVQLEELEVE
jgi:hypothetical protein